MKLKELKRTVNISWSPTEYYPITLAAGSAAQQVDASFSSNAHLEIYELNFNDPGYDLEPKASLQTQNKFQKLVWSNIGVLVGGCDGGLLQFYNVERLLKGASDSLISSNSKHNGHVSALDINPYQKNLLASGASDSEIYIWDLNNTAQPMAPGNKSQPFDHVQGLCWNQQVQHILASTFATRCVVWDLRKNEPIMKLSDAQSRTRWRSLAWHPRVATQLCIASEDDQVPVIQLWDLRLAASPVVTMESHQKGVMALSWCKQDPDLLLSAGKDGRVLCWNPNNTTPGGELLSEISHEGQWIFDVAWCNRDPSLIATASFDAHVSIHSVNGGSRPAVYSTNQSNIMDSFGGMDSFNQLPVVQHQTQQHAIQNHQLLPRAPLWAKKPVGAKFAFGGKLIMFEKCPQESQKIVYVSQVINDPELVDRANELDTVIGSGPTVDQATTDRLAEYCRQRGDAATDQSERYTWFFLRANFLPNFRSEVLNLLGFKIDEIPSKFKSPSAITGDFNHLENNVDSITSGIAGLSRGESTETDAELSTDTSTDLSDAHTLIERKLSNVHSVATAKNITIPNGEDPASLICRALMCGNLEEAVELCLEAKRIADALVIASLGSQELLYKVQKYHLNSTSSDPVSLLSRTLLMSKWDGLVEDSSPKSWRETLATLVTHCEGDVLEVQCELLGDKLSKENDPSLSDGATICYLCAMSSRALNGRVRRADVGALARLTTLARLLRSRRPPTPGGQLDAVLSQYALRLASQGCLQSALNCLEVVPQSELKDRLTYALGAPKPDQRRQSGQTYNRTRTTSGHSQKRAPLAPHEVNPYSTTPSYDQNWQQQPIASQPYSAPTPPAPAPAQPPRTGSAGPQTGGGITSRSKYKVDPSVQSAPLYGQYSFNQPAVSQPGPMPGYGYNNPMSDQHSAASVPNPSFNPGMNAMNPLNPNVPAINPSQMPVNPGVINGGYYNPQQAAPPDAPPTPAPARPAAPGWNDPPIMAPKSKPKPEVTPAQAPITHPLFGVEPPQQVPLNPVQPVQNYSGQQYHGQQFPGQQYTAQQYPMQQYPGQEQHQQQYSVQQQYPGQMPQTYPQQAPSPASVEPPAPPQPVQKPPIPEQHAVMQTIFDALREQCSARANNPQMKRKLEDVQRRLENLYDMLREYRLTENALSSLHACAQHARGGDYEGALNACTALATGPDFAAAASFLPGMKVLIQLAHQLQVYIS